MKVRKVAKSRQPRPEFKCVGVGIYEFYSARAVARYFGDDPVSARKSRAFFGIR